MNKMTHFTVLTLILIPLLTSCSYKNVNSRAFLSSSTEAGGKNPSIIIQSPVTLSNNSMLQIYGKNQYLRLKMVKGRYYEDWNIGAYSGA